jgi:phosphodiesterase/alkaline phosphatase D-like protein
MKIAFCSCNHPLVHRQQPGWLALAEHAPDVLLLLGDNVYIENTIDELIGNRRPCMALSDLAYAQRLHARYAAQWAVAEFRQALRAVHARDGRVLGTLDDHDFLGNDTHVSPILERKARLARQLHRQFIAACNASALSPLGALYPSFDDVLGMDDVGYAQGIGLAHSLSLDAAGIAVKILMLDNRSYRQAPFANGLTAPSACLGAAQISWLAQELVGSQRITLIASGSTLSAGDRAGIAGSPLAAYRHEVNVLRTLYRGMSAGGQRLVHLGGDLHYNAYWPANAQFPWSELASSGMGSGWQPFAGHQRGNFGVLTISQNNLRMQLLGSEPERNLDTSMEI